MKRLEGLVTALMMTWDAERNFDAASFDKLIDYVLAGGIDALFVLSVAGEFPVLNMETRKRVMERAYEKVEGRVPLIAGVVAESAGMVLDNIENYAVGKAEYALTTPPGFRPMSQEQCYQFYHTIAANSPLPVIVYNGPYNRNYVESETIARLAEDPNIVGLKETDTMSQLTKMYLAVENINDFTLLSGNEHAFFPALAIGLDAFIMGGPGNMFPGLCREILDRHRQGDEKTATNRFLEMCRFMGEIYNLPCGALPAVKGVLSILNLCDKYMALPTETVSEEQLKFVRQAMAKSGLFEGSL